MRRLKGTEGADAFFGGLGFVSKTPGVWGYALVPVGVLVVLGVGLSALGYAAASRAADSLVGPSDGGLGHALVTALLTAVLVLVAALVSFSLAQPLSGPALEAIVRRQESALGVPPWPKQGVLVSLLRTLGVTLLGLAVWLPAVLGLTLVGMAFPPATLVTVPLKFVVSAYLVAWDLLDYPFGLRGEGIGARLAFVWNNKGAVFAFGSLGALVMLVPGAGVFLLPFGVAGAARLLALADASPAPR